MLPDFCNAYSGTVDRADEDEGAMQYLPVQSLGAEAFFVTQASCLIVTATK
jgi:hypothetical protein